jgi:hypothetical protein
LVPAASLDASHILGGSHGHFCGTDRPLSVIAGMPTINLPRSGLLEPRDAAERGSADRRQPADHARIVERSSPTVCRLRLAMTTRSTRPGSIPNRQPYRFMIGFAESSRCATACRTAPRRLGRLTSATSRPGRLHG